MVDVTTQKKKAENNQSMYCLLLATVWDPSSHSLSPFQKKKAFNLNSFRTFRVVLSQVTLKAS